MRFDPERVEDVGLPLTILEGVISSEISGAVQYSLSLEGNGKLAYISGGPEIFKNNLVWVNRKGEELDFIDVYDKS